MMEFFQTFADWYMGHMNYFTITLLMTIESSFIPFPSEIVIPPAAWKAAAGGLNIYLVVFFATIGALIGAIINYYLALWLGRTIVYRFVETKIGKMCLLNKNKIEHAEAYFVRHGRSSTFIGRLVPAVRQLISIPAGLARMNLKHFIIFTALGSTIWHAILAFLTLYVFHLAPISLQKETIDFHELSILMKPYMKELSYGFLLVGVLFVVYLIIVFLKKRR